MGRMTEDGWEEDSEGDEGPSDEEIEAELRWMEENYLVTSLEGDLRTCIDLLGKTKPNDTLNEFYRRTLVRTTFAIIEGLCALELDRARALSVSKHCAQEYTDDERDRLQDKRRKEAKETIKVALSFVGRGARDLPTINYETSKGWAKMIDAIRIRDRLVHPKRGDDMVVLDEEIVNEARGWFMGKFYKRKEALQNKTNEEVRQKVREVMERRAAREAAKSKS
ncbi:MAG: hypothetical protein ACLP1X_24910 [Polyangiaceae bacterium]